MKKLSKRLQKINSMINNRYQHIWDCCCDHGLLGLTLLTRKAANNIHFVDIVPSLTAPLELLLQTHFSSTDYAQYWQVHCIDVAKLPLTSQNKQLIIIAGVGGKLMIDLIEKITLSYQKKLPENSNSDLEFILCPVHYNYQVRQSLAKHNFTLIDEYIVTENKRFYEIIHVKTSFSAKPNAENKAMAISPTGDKMWNLSLVEHQRYLAKTISHYQRMLLTTMNCEQSAIEKSTIKKIIKQYSALAP
jgi:tRNA (adenine22-N1)-methyltransferase